MRLRLVLLAVLALAVAGTAGAASSKPKLVRVVKRDGAITATLTYRLRDSGPVRRPTLSVSKDGRQVLRRRMCPLDWSANGVCQWNAALWWPMKGRKLEFRRVAGSGRSVVLDLYTGGAHCCEQTFIALVGTRVRWIAHDWKNPGYHGERIGDRYYFVSGDNRFDDTFTSYAFSWAPAQVWALRNGRLTDVTRSVPSVVRVDAKNAWRHYLGRWGRRDRQIRGVGALAGWCADEYLLSRGAKCEKVLGRALAGGYLNPSFGLRGRAFIRGLNRDLERWGYKRR
jgi:hypothetical protein